MKIKTDKFGFILLIVFITSILYSNTFINTLDEANKNDKKETTKNNPLDIYLLCI